MKNGCFNKGSNKAQDMSQSAPEFAEGIRKFANVRAGLQRWERECSPAPQTENRRGLSGLLFPVRINSFCQDFIPPGAQSQPGETTVFMFVSAQVFLESAQVSPLTQK